MAEACCGLVDNATTPEAGSEAPKAEGHGVDASLRSLVSEAGKDIQPHPGDHQDVVNVIDIPNFYGSMSLQAAQGEIHSVQMRTYS